MMIVTHCDQNLVAGFEGQQKEKFLSLSDKDKRPTLSFAHNYPSQATADKAKEKRVKAIVFDTTCTPEYVANTTKAVIRKMNGNSPSFFYLREASSLPDVKQISDYNDLKRELDLN